jgi:hypothetical protein
LTLLAAKRGANIVADIKSENIDIAMRKLKIKTIRTLRIYLNVQSAIRKTVHLTTMQV